MQMVSKLKQESSAGRRHQPRNRAKLVPPPLLLLLLLPASMCLGLSLPIPDVGLQGSTHIGDAVHLRSAVKNG
jgi:hypothetical protein